jgi:tetratricopeptide (TPR) repeat protein
LQYAPANLKCWITKAHAEFSLFRLDEAERSYKEVLEVDPKHLDSLVNLAAIAEQHNNVSDASLWYERILEIYPEHSETLKRYGRMAAKSMPPQTAIPLLERAQEANPHDTAILMLLACAYELGHRFDDAIELFREAQRRNPKLARTADHKIAKLTALKSRRIPDMEKKEDRNVSA